MTALMTAPPARPRRWEWNKHSRDSTQQTISVILWTLHELGGEITDQSGRCGYELIAEARKRGYYPHPIHDPFAKNVGTVGSLSQLFYELDCGNYAGCISRVCNGKRTHKVTLLISEAQLPPKPKPVVVKKVEPSAPPKPKVGDTRPAPVAVKAATPPPPPVAPTAVDDSETGQSVSVPKGLDIAPPLSEPAVEPVLPPLVMVEGNAVDILLQIQQLAMQATLVVANDIGKAAEAPEVDDDRDRIAVRLAETLEENNRLRRKLNEANETVLSKSKENEALQKAVMMAQSNLKAMQDAHAGASDRERNLARLKGNQRFIAQRPEPAIAARS